MGIEGTDAGNGKSEAANGKARSDQSGSDGREDLAIGTMLAGRQ
jgi:hypothetical protein